MAAHTERILCIEPWHGTSVTDGTQARIAESRGVTVARVARRTVAERRATVNLHYLIGDHDEPIRHVVEEHHLGVFDARELADMLEGFDVEQIEWPDSPQGLLVAMLR
jgi:hypothetical protein